MKLKVTQRGDEYVIERERPLTVEDLATAIAELQERETQRDKNWKPQKDLRKHLRKQQTN